MRLLAYPQDHGTRHRDMVDVVLQLVRARCRVTIHRIIGGNKNHALSGTEAKEGLAMDARFESLYLSLQ